MLQLSNINKSYRLGQLEQQALFDVSLQVVEAELVGLCGPSGSGKSTLLNICGLLDQQFDGQVYFSGEQVTGPQQAMRLRRSQLGFVFQRFNLVPVMSAFENVEYPLQLNRIATPQRKQRVNELLEAVGMLEHAGKRPDRLSGGQQQRIALARAMVLKPRLVIADEPTASLDSQTAHQVVSLMKQLSHQHGTSIVVATHDDRMSSHCDRIIRMEDGRVVSDKEALCVA
ncbi:ABC transporter ATP-binding protein [Aliagarivorans taiwanensis]|uniref:ABC transporter ATP-binding protein n=1 Tax=Aliagarivorans taiwanensis TaxID=561966 RepID=UPI0004295698|nr:ABC transporter ATP-binding protein [Aliagarivorans taiwanensis]